MGSYHNLEMFGCGTSESCIPFQLEFSEEFLTEPQEVSFTMGRAPLCDTWRPMQCPVYKNKINWESKYTDANVFNYYTNPKDYWSNYIIIQRTNCCQVQFQYDDNTKSEIYDLGNYDGKDDSVKIPLFENKKIVKVIVHKAKGKQLEKLLFGRDSCIPTETLIIGKQYALVKSWSRLWPDYVGSSGTSWYNREKEDRDKVLAKYPNFAIDKDPNTHNLSTDGKICSVEKVVILDVKIKAEMMDPIENVEFRKYHIGCGYDVTYQRENGEIDVIDMGHDFTYLGQHCTIDQKLAWFSDAYKSGKNTKEYIKSLEEQYTPLREIEIERVNNEWLKYIETFKGTSKLKLETVLIGNLNWTIKPITLKKETILGMSKRFVDVIPTGFRIPTKEDWIELNKFQTKIDEKNKCIIFSDNLNELKLKIMGHKSPNGSHWDKEFSTHFWMNIDHLKPDEIITEIVELTHGGYMNFKKVNIEPEYGAVLMLVK